MTLLKLLAVLVAGALLYHAGRAAAESPALRLERVEVRGNSEGRVGSEEVAAAAGVEIGEQLVAISTKQVSDRVERIPWILSARVERILPSTLRITVEERNPALVLRTPDAPFLVESGGLVLEEGAQSDLVELVDLPAERVAAGERITSPEFVQATHILSSLPAEIRSAIALIRAPSIDRIQLETASGSVIYYGAAEQVEEKNYAALALLPRLSQPPGVPGVIDVRVPSRPAFRPL